MTGTNAVGQASGGFGGARGRGPRADRGTSGERRPEGIHRWGSGACGHGDRYWWRDQGRVEGLAHLVFGAAEGRGCGNRPGEGVGVTGGVRLSGEGGTEDGGDGL